MPHIYANVYAKIYTIVYAKKYANAYVNVYVNVYANAYTNVVFAAHSEAGYLQDNLYLLYIVEISYSARAQFSCG